ncbi:MAG: hypothetical protein PHT02_01260 [Tissierellia bacterium]|nr:hypothetical protein [Tissierellia bacterium]
MDFEKYKKFKRAEEVENIIDYLFYNTIEGFEDYQKEELIRNLRVLEEVLERG